MVAEMVFDGSQEFEQLYRREGPAIWRALLALTGDEEIANDALSEAVVQCLGRGEAIRDQKAWLWRSSFRIATGMLGGRSVVAFVSDDPTYEMAPLDVDVLHAIAQLPERQRVAIVLRYFADFDMKRIAEVLECATPTARVHLMRARRTLADRLEMRDG